MQKSRFLLLTSIIVIAAAARMIPFVLGALGLTDVTQVAGALWNFSPVTALFLFGGAQFADRRAAYLTPLVAMLLSDIGIGLLLGDMSMGLHPVIPAMYGCYAMIVWLGRRLRDLKSRLNNAGSDSVSASRLRRWQTQVLLVLAAVGAGILGELLYFTVTNFAQWIVQTGYYPHTAAGLVQCYVAGIPFLKNALSSTPIFAVVAFGGHAIAESWFPAVDQSSLAPAAQQTVAAV